jgi:hypothetical protein
VQNLYGRLTAQPPDGPGLAGGSVLNLHLVLTQAFSQAVRWQLLGANPVAGAQPPRPRQPPRFVVDPVLLRRLLDAVAGWWLEASAAIPAASGMRRGEILALRGATSTACSLCCGCSGRCSRRTRGWCSSSRRRHACGARLLPEFLRPFLERQRDDQRRCRGELGERWLDDGLVVDRGDGGPLNPDSLSAGWALLAS